ncbi:MAG: 50S ribosomal protein L6, partial [Candidatus Micrarchaeota archaeon]
RIFRDNDVTMEAKDGSITIIAPESRVTNTIKAHITNMIIGVTEGYKHKMQIVYSHFPITLEIKGSIAVIKNFQGEKKPRRAKIVRETKVEVKGQDVLVSGIDKEDVGQTISNLITATKIKNRDSRIFQDGIYHVEE